MRSLTKANVRRKPSGKASPRARTKRPRGAEPTVRRRVITLAALVLALVGGLVFLFFFSAAFVVKDVRVTGVEGELAESVERLAQVPNGRPLARVSEGRVSERVLQDLRVAGVSVDSDWTDSVVTLSATPREPALVLRQGGSTWLSDVGGVVYDEVEKPSNKLPSVTVPTRPTELGEGTVQGLVELWRTRPDPAELEGELSTPRLDKNGMVSMTVDGLTIVWGEPVEAEKKWQIIRALVAQESIDPQGGIEQRIDVSLPGTPVVTGIPEAPRG